MKEYMLSVHDAGDDAAPEETPEEMQEMFKAVDEFNAELMGTDAWVFAGGLQPPTSATTVRVDDGELLITDGPFAETKEFLGGFWILKAADLDAALALAEKASVACGAPVEVRPFQDEPEG